MILPARLTMCSLLCLMAIGTIWADDPKTIPEGNYSLAKLSGSSLINLGTLEIRKNTYRTDEKGKFEPYTVDAKGNITWSAGLAFLPDGWKHDYSKITKDSKGKPLVQIHYISGSGTKDSIDGYKEK
ncbi:MAG: hypothetical protein QM703_26465 [Gemmatales bacterium]